MSSMNYKGYTARIEFDEHDGVFWGKVLGLPAKESITFEGDNVAQLTQDFRNAIDFYLEDCAKTGRQPLKPASGKLMLRVDPTVHSAALIAAQSSGQSLNQWAAAALAQAAHV
ncbi:MAG: type II toxin-antitoxin system HicB family antitoxin [Rhodoferax sp.]|nr:type II toxin-antitoxin system HicB family antitoxin [Betaproteobacteria bacterium]NCN97930.1 type II toxin-antitoxin system HicB family antitoxin [Rhodoferax sp.]OIP13422.1 MAG: antitoxin HicB [Comamonadaceae bacterium CG2_30_57_122]PJC14717.1 MAG: toxin-antitoxin system HicB family antitoxin [Comamonadaceae bacterium CG_4_9_14_0_8_um_filter_57_21]NCP83102.1 type II toxin-antitoxin system HicB family antitoxin [Rhodoferax sp.]